MKPKNFIILCTVLLLLSAYTGLAQVKSIDEGNTQDLKPSQLLENVKSNHFTGRVLDFKFHETEVLKIFEYLEKISGLEFEFDSDVYPRLSRKVTYIFRGIPWDRMLFQVLRDNEFELILENDVLTIKSLYKLLQAVEPEARNKKIPFVWFLFAGTLLAAAGLTIFFIRKKHRLEAKSQNPKKFPLDPDTAEEIKKRIIFLFDVEKIYRDESLSLVSLAEKLKLPPHHLSRVLNDFMKTSFSLLVNTCRIDEVKKRLTEATDNDLTILDIALDTGFNTKTAFNRVFKQQTGMTPSQYKKRHSK